MKNIYLLLLLLASSMGYSQCIINHTALEPDVVTPFTTRPFGQSFIAECTGFLDSVAFISAGSGFLFAGDLNIYAGNTVIGEPIYTQEHPVVQVEESNTPITVELTEEFAVTEGEQYTFELTVPTAISIYISFPNAYDGGDAWQNGIERFPDIDFLFTVVISEDPLSTEDVGNQNTLTVFPNPSTNFIQVSGLTSPESYKIYNILGAEVKQGVVSNGEAIEVNDFSNGLYILNLNNQKLFKFIKE